MIYSDDIIAIAGVFSTLMSTETEKVRDRESITANPRILTKKVILGLKQHQTIHS